MWLHVVIFFPPPFVFFVSFCENFPNPLLKIRFDQI